MTKKLEDLFDLPPSEPDGIQDSPQSEPGNDVETNLPVLPETLVALDKIEAALPAVRGLESSDQEMDDLAKMATESFQDLSNLGMNVDSRYASEIFAVASQMLGHAITAKNAKLNKKLKMIELQMKKLKLDREAQGEDIGPIPSGQGHVLDRNELLRQILDKSPAEGSNDKKR